MIDIKPELLERKLLGEDCWIELTEEVKIKIDYPTRAQETELRRLKLLWSGETRPAEEHWLDFYFRSTVKDVRGFSISGKEAKLELKNGYAKELTNGDVKLDIVATFGSLGILEAAIGLIHQKLDFTEADKKKFSSQPNSLKKESSEDQKDSTPILKFATPNIPLTKTDEKSLEKPVV